MKKIILIFLLVNFNYLYSQTPATIVASSVDVFGESDVNGNQVAKIGIGEFAAQGDEPQAALDVRVPYLYPSNFTSSYQQFPSEAFQTTTERDYGTVWRMYSGSNSRDRIQRFRILNPDPANSVYAIDPNPISSIVPYGTPEDIQLSVVEDGNMDFMTTDKHWMRLSKESNKGYLGLNDFENTNDWYPRSILHMNRKSELDVFAQFTNDLTGYTSSIQGFKVGIAKENAELRQHSNAPIKISSQGPTAFTERMRITHGPGGPPPFTQNNMTKVSISYGGTPVLAPITDPLAMLNLGEGILINSLGNRSWMEVGTHMVKASDQMYVGIKNESTLTHPDRGTAVINWGDNPTPGFGPDMLKFIFTGGYIPGSSVARNTQDGLEIARMTAYGNVGIGPGWDNATILPKRRLDLFDNAASGGAGTPYPDHVPGPQLRLTNTSSTTLTGGIYADFETTALGDLELTPLNAGVERRVGIHKPLPITTLHVGGIAGSTGAITSDYLSHPPSSFPYLVYSDANGTLNNLAPAPNSSFFLQGDGTWGSPGSTLGVTACPGVLTNYISLFDASSNICKSLLYDNGTSVGLGLSSGLFSRFQIGGLGTSFSTIGCLIQNSNGDDYFQARDNGHVIIGSGIANKDGRLGIGISYDPEAPLVVRTFETVSSSLQRAMEVRNGNDDKMFVVWADKHVTLGYTSIPNLSTFGGDARLIVNGSGFAQAAHFDGSVYSTVGFITSDSTLKQNIVPLQDVSGIINALNPREYEYDTFNNPSLNLPAGTHYGLLAQEVERILPNLVAEQVSPADVDSSGNILTPEKRFKALNYIELIPVLLQAIKDQNVIIDSLSQNDSLIYAALADLRSQINSCCSSQANRVGSRVSPIDVEISSENAIILNQNDPNPFNERTRISYNIPEYVKSAEIIFYTSKGIVLKTVVIDHRGVGEMNVFASDLSSGIYMYSLVVDGKTVDSKKMVCVK